MSRRERMVWVVVQGALAGIVYAAGMACIHATIGG